MFKKFRKEIILTIAVIMLCCVTVLVVNTIFLTEEGDKNAEVEFADHEHFADGYIEVDVHAVLVDPVEEHMVLELEFIPFGSYDEGDGLLSVPLEVDVSGLSGEPIYFEAGKRMYPHEVEIDFYEGEVEGYPFDEHRALFEIVIAEEINADGNWTSVPTELDFLGFHHGYAFYNVPLPASDHGYLGYDIHLKRSPLVVGTVIFWMATIWGLTLINLALLVGVFLGRVQGDFGLFGYMSDFIVAMYFFREMFPDIPPFLGVLSDYMSVFWAILVAAVIANIVAIKWLIALFKNENGEADSVG